MSLPIGVIEAWAVALNPDEGTASDSAVRAVEALSDDQLGRVRKALEVLRIAVVCEMSDRKNRAFAASLRPTTPGPDPSAPVRDERGA